MLLPPYTYVTRVRDTTTVSVLFIIILPYLMKFVECFPRRQTVPPRPTADLMPNSFKPSAQNFGTVPPSLEN